MGKLDDLADCLLQGLAWVQWEENKRLLLKKGVEVLLEP
jgi:cruciform cutting endonuclease 1